MFSWFRYAATITEGDHKCKRWFMHRDENLLASHGSEKIAERGREGASFVTRQKKEQRLALVSVDLDVLPEMSPHVATLGDDAR